ncbi:MAG: baseplate J/gp47 family protein [Ruminococcus sp.]|nr:baseplate J/gp47 family protein [Ruminococcus sp.]
MVKIDSRGRQEIREQLKKRAAGYTPEWNLDEESPDIAAALALACADMFEGTVRKINSLPLKNEIAFFNTIDSSLLPAAPSEGYVSFGLSSEDMGTTEVPKGTVLSSYGGDGEPVRFETLDEVLVSPAKIAAAFCVDDSLDRIGRYETVTSFEQGLFSLPRENLQTHTLTMSHPYAFNIDTEGVLCLCFCRGAGAPLMSSAVAALADSSVKIEYLSADQGYVPFEDIHERGGRLYLRKQRDMPAIVSGGEQPALRITAPDIAPVKELCYSYAEALPSGRGIVPDMIYNGNTELNPDQFFPFGERFQLFSEIYIGCAEVLDKRGASVTLSFDLNMIKVPIENQIEDEIKWKWIANKDSFKERASYEIAITEVIWEYYNGYGWSRLFKGSEYSDIFNYTQGVTGSFRSMTFICPEDMSPVFVGACEDVFIRARVIKAENLYKLRGNYISPEIRNISFEYHYEDRGCRITDSAICNCLEEKSCGEGEEFTPFYGTGVKGRAVYLGFNVHPDNGPLRIMWDVREDPLAQRSELVWEYLSESGWKHMNMVDETESFTAAGLTIFLDNHGFKREHIFGEELYWVRISDRGGAFAAGNAAPPVIEGIYYNSVRAVNTDSHREETFAMNVYTENAEFALSMKSLLDVEVYVNEYPSVTEEERRLLLDEGRLREVTDSAGMITEQWVKWQEVSTFITENGSSRCFIADRSRGTVTFGSGRKGRIPSASASDNIRIIYTTGGGRRSNAAPGEINSMERSIGFVSSVTNPKRFYGGCDTETVYEALRRSSVMLRTQGKAVTVRDFEELAFAASRSIEKVRCFKGRNIAGEPEHGAVTLVVLKDRDSEFSTLRRTLESYLLPRMAGSLAASGKFYITEPAFVKMNIKAELAADRLEGIFELKRRAEQCIRDCIGSYSGREGSRSWMLGRIPNEQQLRSALLRIKSVEFIRSINITAFVSGAGGFTETDPEEIKAMPYILPICGESDISITLV